MVPPNPEFKERKKSNSFKNCISFAIAEHKFDLFSLLCPSFRFIQSFLVKYVSLFIYPRVKPMSLVSSLISPLINHRILFPRPIFFGASILQFGL
jgi:hypothetical protein